MIMKNKTWGVYACNQDNAMAGNSNLIASGFETKEQAIEERNNCFKTAIHRNAGFFVAQDDPETVRWYTVRD